MRILVVGCGGIGGIVAAGLAGQGVDVRIVSRSAAAAEAVNRHGFRLRGVGGVRVVRGAVDLALPDGPFDYALLATQPNDLAVAAEQAASRLGPGGRLVTLPNGLPEERVAAQTGLPVIGAIVGWGATHPEPGVFDRTSTGGFVLGRLDGEPDAAVDTLGRLLAPIGAVTTTANLRGARWSKLAINCAISSLGTVGGDRLGSLLRFAYVRRLALEVMSEVVGVARMEGVRLEPISGMVDLERMALPPRSLLGLWARHAVLIAVGLRYRRLRSSMLAALERGQVPPVDFLNGEVVDRAVRHGLPSPVNRALVDRIHGFAAGAGRPAHAQLRALYDHTRAA